MQQKPETDQHSPTTSRPVTYLMAAAAGVAVANICYSQPMPGLMEAALPGRLSPLIPTATQLGYAVGVLPHSPPDSRLGIANAVRDATGRRRDLPLTPARIKAAIGA